MAATKSLTNLYDQLAPTERVRLYIEAGARHDWAERSRLIGTCPKATYRELDYHFEQGIDAAQFVTLTLLLDLRPDARMLIETHRFAERVKRARVQGTPPDADHKRLRRQKRSSHQGEQVQDQNGAIEHADDADRELSLAVQEEFYDCGMQAAMDIGESIPDLMDALTGMRVNFRSVWAAWEEFCQEQWHMDGLMVVRGNAGELADEVVAALKLCEGAEPNAEIAREYRGLYKKLLSLRGGA